MHWYAFRPVISLNLSENIYLLQIIFGSSMQHKCSSTGWQQMAVKTKNVLFCWSGLTKTEDLIGGHCVSQQQQEVY